MAWRSEIASRHHRRWNSRNIRAAFARFAREQSGAVALLFGLALVPVAGLMGLALDYSRGQLARAQLQSAVDSAGLAVAQMPKETSIADIQAEAKKWVAASLISKGVDPAIISNSLIVTAAKKPDNSGYTFRASLDVGITLFNVVANHENPSASGAMTVAASNEVDWSLGNVEVALALDNTGSMSGEKIENLKTAAASLVKLLKDAAQKDGQVRVSLIPFSQSVRLDPSYRSKPWMDKGLSPINSEIFWSTDPTKISPNRFDLWDSLGIPWAGCVETRPQPYDVEETAAATATPATLFVPQFAPDEPDSGSQYANDYLKDDTSETNWKRRQGNVAKYIISNIKDLSGDRGPNKGCAMQTVIPLTDARSADFSILENAIPNMVPVGWTNVPIGMAWAWHTLSPLGPFEAKNGVPYGTPHHSKFVVLMTDGENTFDDPHNCATSPDNENKNRSAYQSLGYAWQNRLNFATPLSSPYKCEGTRTARMDERLKLLCTNMKQPFDPSQPKKQKVYIFTIGVQVPESVLSLLKECADPGRFYDVTDPSQMNAVFTKIGEEIKQLRLAK
jgi:Flp pilus assembly protein TadG